MKLNCEGNAGTGQDRIYPCGEAPKPPIRTLGIVLAPCAPLADSSAASACAGHLDWITADELYAASGEFLDPLGEMHVRYVVAISELL